MKKSLLTLILCTVAMGIGYAQFTDGLVLQPTSVCAKHFDASGQLIKEMTSTYGYDIQGKLTTYNFSDHSLWTTYSYNDNLLMREYIQHRGGHPVYDESFNYTYENFQVKTKTHLWGAMNENEYWVYSYNSDGRLERIDNKEEYDSDYHRHWLYEYENGGRTKIESYYSSYVGYVLVMRTEYEYDEAFNLLSAYREKYNSSGVTTQTTLITHTYTSSGKKAEQVTQTLTDGEWVNTEIIRYVYDDNDRVTEWQVGSWSDENADWELTSRATYELNEEALTLTVTFYKKSGDEWVWEDYDWLVNHKQPVFFEPYLVEQEHALRYYGYDDLYETEHINQFVFTLAEMNEPTYEDTEEHKSQRYSIYPNPSTGKLSALAPTEDAVIRLYNLQGQLVLARPFDFSAEINAEELPSGIYVWEIWHDSQKQAGGKWVKE